jgi:hypothetical protein
MAVRLEHHIVLEHPPGEKMALPGAQLEKGGFDHFSPFWALKPRRVINWEQSFRNKLGFSAKHYQLTGSYREAAGHIRHHFVCTKKGINSQVEFRQEGDCDAVLQGDVITLLRREPVVFTQTLGQVHILEPSREFLEFISTLDWTTRRKDINAIAAWFGMGLGDNRWEQWFVEAVTDLWADNRSFLRVRII